MENRISIAGSATENQKNAFWGSDSGRNRVIGWIAGTGFQSLSSGFANIWLIARREVAGSACLCWWNGEQLHSHLLQAERHRPPTAVPGPSQERRPVRYGHPGHG